MNLGKYQSDNDHIQRSNFLHQKEPTVKWVMGIVETAFIESELNSDQIMAAVEQALGRANSRKENSGEGE
jgi:hypothetical protein